MRRPPTLNPAIITIRHWIRKSAAILLGSPPNPIQSSENLQRLIEKQGRRSRRIQILGPISRSSSRFQRLSIMSTNKAPLLSAMIFTASARLSSHTMRVRKIGQWPKLAMMPLSVDSLAYLSSKSYRFKVRHPILAVLITYCHQYLSLRAADRHSSSAKGLVESFNLSGSHLQRRQNSLRKLEHSRHLAIRYSTRLLTRPRTHRIWILFCARSTQVWTISLLLGRSFRRIVQSPSCSNNHTKTVIIITTIIVTIITITTTFSINSLSKPSNSKPWPAAEQMHITTILYHIYSIKMIQSSLNHNNSQMVPCRHCRLIIINYVQEKMIPYHSMKKSKSRSLSTHALYA